MTREPLRAFRAGDVLWNSALARARDDRVSLSFVLRDALRSFVDESRPAPDAVEERDTAGDEAPHAARALTQVDEWAVVARAQGILMNRLACDHEIAMDHLVSIAAESGSTVPSAARAVVASTPRR